MTDKISKSDLAEQSRIQLIRDLHKEIEALKAEREKVFKLCSGAIEGDIGEDFFSGKATLAQEILGAMRDG